MDDLLSSLFEAVVETDTACETAMQKYGKAMIAVRETLGGQHGALTDALDAARAAEEEALFQAGLRTGLRLMALCLQEG